MIATIHNLFNHPGLRAALLRARAPLGLAVAAVVVWFAQPRWLWAGCAVSMLVDAAKKIRLEFLKLEEEITKKINIDDFVRALLAGASQITEVGLGDAS